MSPPHGRPKEGSLPASLEQREKGGVDASAGATIRLGVDPRARTDAGPLAAWRTSPPGGTARSAKEVHTSVLVLESVLICPRCGFEKQETMPTDACQFFYECAACNTLLRPKPGDCCVFCSYGSVSCPPKQQDGICCRPA